MNPSGMPPKTSLLLPIKPSTTSAADKILEDAKRVTEMPAHQLVAQVQSTKNDESAKVPAVLAEIPKFDVDRFIRDFEQDAVDRKFGHLGVGDYDKLLIENIQQNCDFVPERDQKIHLLITQSVGRYDIKTRNRVNK